jgi:hypothetical protein
LIWASPCILTPICSPLTPVLLFARLQPSTQKISYVEKILPGQMPPWHLPQISLCDDHYVTTAPSSPFYLEQT